MRSHSQTLDALKAFIDRWKGRGYEKWHRVLTARSAGKAVPPARIDGAKRRKSDGIPKMKKGRLLAAFY